MAEIQYDSMRVPYSEVRCGVRWTGDRIVVIPLDKEGKHMPYGELVVGLRNKRGRKVWLDRNKYQPHQGARECARRRNNPWVV